MISDHLQKNVKISKYPFLQKLFYPKDCTRDSGNVRINLKFEGRERFYKIHLPQGYDNNQPAALILNFHGGAGSPDDQQIQSKMDEVSDQQGFIVVYPAGTGTGGDHNLFFNAGNVHGYAKAHNVNDIGFVEYIIQDLEKKFTIDPTRIFCTGFSNGAKFCYLLAARLSHVIAAIGAVSGTTAFPKDEYKPQRCVSIIHFHGTADPVNPYEGGSGLPLIEKISGTTVYNTPVKEMISHFVEVNECRKGSCRIIQKGNAQCESYGPGKEGTEVILWTLIGGGHTWPGGESTLPKFMAGGVSNDICASELIWEFFKAHPMH